MKMKAIRPMRAVLAAFVSTLIPFGPADAQWVLRVCKEMNKECQVGG